MLKYRYSFGLFLIGFIIQSTLLNHIGIFGVTPNLILCLVIIFTFLYEGNHGLIFGLIFGLISDICFAEIIGIAALSYFMVAFICLEMKRYLYKESLVSMLIVSSVGTACYALFYLGISQILGSGVALIYAVKTEAILIIYNGIIVSVMYLIMSRKVIKHRSDRYMYRGNLQEARSLDKG